MEDNKNYIRNSVALLKRQGIIQYDSDIAKTLHYSRGAVSELLNPNSSKPMTYSFMKKFKDVYGKYIDEINESEKKSKANNNQNDRLDTLECQLRVLKESMVTALAHISGKQPALISAELDEAVRILKKNNGDG